MPWIPGKRNMLLGIDESGRGPVIGDMVIAGVVLPSRRSERLLKKEGVKDSKELSRKKREALFPIIQQASSMIVTKTVTASDVDSWRESGRSLNELEAKVFAEIINETRPRLAIVDCSDVVPRTFRKRMARYIDGEAPRLICEHFADRNYPVVSAASIIAKVTRDRGIRDLCEEVGQLGTGYCSDRRTVEFLVSWFDSKGSFPPFVRRTWRTVDRIRQDGARRRISDRGL